MRRAALLASRVRGVNFSGVYLCDFCSRFRSLSTTHTRRVRAEDHHKSWGIRYHRQSCVLHAMDLVTYLGHPTPVCWVSRRRVCFTEGNRENEKAETGGNLGRVRRARARAEGIDVQSSCHAHSHSLHSFFGSGY